MPKLWHFHLFIYVKTYFLNFDFLLKYGSVHSIIDSRIVAGVAALDSPFVFAVHAAAGVAAVKSLG